MRSSGVSRVVYKCDAVEANVRMVAIYYPKHHMSRRAAYLSRAVARPGHD